MARLSKLTLIGVILFACVYGWVTGLRHVSLWVPEAVLNGNNVKLRCDYDLEQAALYSIKWYRGDEEFYRYVPKESPPTRVFALPGVRVDIDFSDAHQVTLTEVQKQLTGLYKCEVSADAPLFHTDIKEAHMTVVDAPAGEPSLTSDKLRYSAGEQVRATCTSLPSFPPANITWFVNGQKEKGSALRVALEPDGATASSSSHMDLEANSATFPASKLRLRCEASLYNIYQRSSAELELHEDQPQIASVLGQNTSSDAWRNGGSSLDLLVITSLVLAVLRR